MEAFTLYLNVPRSNLGDEEKFWSCGRDCRSCKPIDLPPQWISPRIVVLKG